MTLTELTTTYNSYKELVARIREVLTNEGVTTLPPEMKKIIELTNKRHTFKKWESGITYLDNDIISFNLDMYRCLASNTGIDPTDTTKWVKVNV